MERNSPIQPSLAVILQATVRRGYATPINLPQSFPCRRTRRLDNAPDRYRLLHARYFENRSVKDLAEAEGLTPHQLSSRLNRIRIRLREWVSRHRDDGPSLS